MVELPFAGMVTLDHAADDPIGRFSDSE